jgi:hypothetical protein
MPTIKKLYTSSGVAITAPTDLNIEGAVGLQSAVFDANNYAIAASVGSSALTIALKSAAGTDCTSLDYASFGFRSATLTSGVYSIVTVTTALSLVVSSGSTLGVASGASAYHYIYAINNAGSVELAISTTKYDDGAVVSTTAEGGAGAADSATAIYSTTARSNVAIRLIGRILSTQTTAGTWAAVPSQVSSNLTGMINGGYTHGSASGVSVPAGYVGEVLTAQNTGQSLSSGDQDFPNTSVTLTAGVWLVNGTAVSDGSGAAFNFSLSWKIAGSTDSTSAISFVQSAWNNSRGTLNLHPRYVNVSVSTAILMRINPSSTQTLYGYVSAVRIA